MRTDSNTGIINSWVIWKGYDKNKITLINEFMVQLITGNNHSYTWNYIYYFNAFCSNTTLLFLFNYTHEGTSGIKITEAQVWFYIEICITVFFYFFDKYLQECRNSSSTEKI